MACHYLRSVTIPRVVNSHAFFVKLRYFHRVTPARAALVLLALLGAGALPLRNTLQAANLTAESVNSVARMDSLFRTVYDPLVSPGKGKGWKPFNRMEWFYGQRAGSIGSDSR